MVAKPGKLQGSFNSGEIAEELWSRNDIKQFYASAAFMRNAEPIPQGGFRGLDRSRDRGAQRAQVVDLAGGVPSGTGGVVLGGGVIAELNYPGPVNIAAFYFRYTATTEQAARVVVKYHDPADNTWKPFVAPAFLLSTQPRARVAARPPGAGILATGVRLELNAGAGSTVTIQEMRAFGEIDAYADVQFSPFTFSGDEAYQFVITSGGIIDIYRDGVFVGAAWHGLQNYQVTTLVPVQRLETALFFHKDADTLRIRRQGADHEWNSDTAPWSEVPSVDLGGTYAKTDERWQVIIRWPTATGGNPDGYLLAVNVDGQETAAIYIDSGNWGGTRASIQTAIAGLPTVSAGVVVNEGTAQTGSKIFEVAFAGPDSGSQFVVSARITNSAEGGATAIRTQKGDPGGEALWSTTRGWARAGIFYQDRLIQGGYRSKNGALLASPTGDYFSGNVEIDAASGGILLNLDTDGAETIQRFARSKHLVIFTSDAEYYVADRALNRTQPTNVVESSRNGSAATVPICSTETGLLYVSKTRSLIYNAVYDDVAQAYVSDPLSLLAKHLIKGINGASLQRANDQNDAARYFLVRDDGLLLVGLIIKSQDVTAFVRWATDGLVKAVSVDGKNAVYLSVERTIGGVPRRRIETLEPGLLVDGSVSQTFGTPQTIIPGLAMHDGASVWAIADGYVSGPYTVAAGAITLPVAASSVTVGRWTPPLVRTLPLPRDVGDRVTLQRPCRVFAVKAKLVGTTSVAIGANGETAEDVPLYGDGQAVDLPQQPVSGWRELDGLEGWTDDGQVEITQVRPGALQVAALQIQAKT